MNTRRFDDHEVVDVVVVGTGAGGAPLLSELARAGLKVVALEAGPRFDPKQHTPDEATASEIYWLEERLSGGNNPMAFGGNNSGTGVGGSMLHFGASCPASTRVTSAFTPRPAKASTGLSISKRCVPMSRGSSGRSAFRVRKTIPGIQSAATPIRRRSAMVPLTR
ncbi:hypothetical protein [Asaia astilbis]|uniref:hypothetical protein n=1 Tax=Asaia astilbis TaxID=610244 RepID=UPI001E5FC436|nr:hypothetical protein [Asaia astilbis]